MIHARTVVGLFLIILGVGFFLRVDVFRVLIPLILIYFGYRALRGSPESSRPGQPSTTHQDYLDDVVIFSALNRRVTSNDFRGGKVAMIFAGGELDLSEAKTKSTAVSLEAATIFGGVKIIVPKEWRVAAEGVGIVGGFDNRAATSGQAKTSLIVKGAAIFGGVEIVRPA